MDVDVVNCTCDNILNLCSEDTNVIHNLKNKISCEFMSFLLEVEKGYRPDYEFIMEEINLLDIYN
jgi:hypothetical protein